MKIFMFICLATVFLSTKTYSQTPDEKMIREILHNQTVSWNEGNLEEFMKGYWNNDSLLFIGQKGPTYGYQTTLENYRKHYPEAASRGVLSFDILQMKHLSELYYFVVGKFHLERTIGNAEGYFTLLFKKVKGKWVIVVDHSS
ncbi:MAG: nuclear transport factor 2 family protein [Chitinophagaceae bacterium]|nr:nuclear transport factor 2 family protein [Chitinophagaceae bacterium]